jgi:hypothetical protein
MWIDQDGTGKQEAAASGCHVCSKLTAGEEMET